MSPLIVPIPSLKSYPICKHSSPKISHEIKVKVESFA